MKTLFTLLIVACQAVVALAQDNDNQTPYLTKSLANDAINSVVVSTSAGGISVSGESGQSPRIEVYIKGNNHHDLTNEEIKKRLEEDYDMNISVNGHELSATVKTRHELSNWNNSMSISFKIYVPEQVNTDLRTSGGGINLAHLKGNETFKTSGGGLNVDHLVGTIMGHTSGGGINVTNSSEDIDLQTSGGGIVAKNCDGKIKLITSGGGLILNDLKGTIDAHTSGGGIEADNVEGELVTSTSGGGIDMHNMKCSLEAHTSGGSLDAQITKLGKYLKLSASAGNVDLELPANPSVDLDLSAERIDDHIASGFKGDWGKRHVEGSLNGGGVPVTVSAHSGDLNLRFN